MIDVHTDLLFVATAAVLVLSRTLASGLATLVGNVVHAMLAGVGVTTVVLLFPVLFQGPKIVGLACRIAAQEGR